jgi:hypothetical protein
MFLIALTTERAIHIGREQMNFPQPVQYCVDALPHQAQGLPAATRTCKRSVFPYRNIPVCPAWSPAPLRRRARFATSITSQVSAALRTSAFETYSSANPQDVPCQLTAVPIHNQPALRQVTGGRRTSAKPRSAGTFQLFMNGTSEMHW